MADADLELEGHQDHHDGHISPEHRLEDGEMGDNRSPTRSPEGSRHEDSEEDEDTDKEEQQFKRKRSPSPKAENAEKKGYDLPRPKRKRERHAWSLPSDLADYYNEFSREFFEDDDLTNEKGFPIKEVNPVPENIVKVPKLDNFVEEDWRDKKSLSEGDHDLARVQERIRDVMGPLAKVWLVLEDVKKDNDTEINIEELVEWTHHSVLLLAQAMNATTYKRRIDVLKNAHGSRGAATSILKKQSDILLKSGESLFGQEFKKNNKSTLKESKDAGALLGKSASSKKKYTSRDKVDQPREQPFRGAPFSGKSFNRGGRGGSFKFKHGKNNNNYGKGKNQNGRNLIQFARTNESNLQGSSSFSEENSSKDSHKSGPDAF